MSEDFIEQIAKQLPVKRAYDDAVSPAAKQVGHIGEDILKTLRLALWPFQFGAALQDRIARFIDNSVRIVPEARRVAPPPQIIGPVLEGIRYEPEATPIDEMFRALLSNSMDSENFDKAHPSFPLLVRQLSRDEAIILLELKSRAFSTIGVFDINPEEKKDPEIPYWINYRIEKELGFPLEKLAIPGKFNFYTEHLFSMGLAHFVETRRQDPVLDENAQIGTRKYQEYRLTPLGRALMEACTVELR